MNQLKKWELFGVLFTMILGSLLHFFYEWSGKMEVIGFFSPVNESVWEHLKILYFPMLFYTLLEYLFLSNHYYNIIWGRAVGLFTGLISIVVLFYTYTGVLGTHLLWMDVGIFLFGAALGDFFSCRLIHRAKRNNKGKNVLGWAIWAVFLILFVYFSYRGPKTGIFQNPQSAGIGSPLGDNQLV